MFFGTTADVRSWRKPVASQANRKQLRWIVHSDLNRLPTAGRLWCAYVAPRVSVDCYRPFATAGRRAARAHKQPAPRWHGYGFLPGYDQPPNNSLPAYAQKASVSRLARRNRRPWYIDPIPSYYGYDGDWHYFGRPGFYGGRYNGGSFGPCWTRTPIGPIWNCGWLSYRLKTAPGGRPF